MGQRLEPYVSSSTKLQRAGKGRSLTPPNSHWLLTRYCDSDEILKRLHSLNFPSSLLTLYSAGSLDVLSTKCSLPSLHRVKPKRIFAPSTFLPLSLNPTVQGVLMCIPQIAVLPLIEPYRTRNTEEHPQSLLFPIWRRVKTQKHAKTRKHSLS